MPGGRERNIMRRELRTRLLRNRMARLGERLARLEATDVSSPKGQRETLLAERAELARQLAALGPDPRAKMG